MYTDQRLELYILRRHAVHRRECNILEFTEHAKRWRALPNPAKIYGDEGARTPWKKIANQLRQLNVDFRQIDLKTYNELRASEGETLHNRIRQVQQWQKSGALEQRWKEFRENEEAEFAKYLPELEAQRKDERGDGMNNRRFSHARPLGVETNAARITPQTEAAARNPEGQVQIEPMQLEEQPEAKMGTWLRTGWTTVQRCCCYPAWRYIIVIFVLGSGIGGWVLYWMRNKGCGDQCLDPA